jgi:hypothetical protein
MLHPHTELRFIHEQIGYGIVIVAEPFRLMPTVAQPLWPLVKDKEILAAVLACHMPIASCRENYYPVRLPLPAQGGDGYTTRR